MDELIYPNIVAEDAAALGAEQSVLGSILIDPRSLDATGDLTADDFIQDHNREIWEAILSLQDAAEAIDPVTVLAKMMDQGTAREADRSYFVELMEITPTAANIAKYAAIVRELAAKRSLREIATDPGAPDTIERTEAALARLKAATDAGSNLFDKFFVVPDLTEEERQPIEFIIDNLIPIGFSVLSGAPKTRKSFMALQMADAVANGKPFLGFNTQRCGVCYFDLEGSKSRIFNRSEQMGIKDGLRNVLITNSETARIGGKPGVQTNLADKIRAMHQQRPDIRFFIIDTYSKARGTVNTKGANAYDADVALLSPMHDMVMEEKIAVLFVHHDRKGADSSSDSLERMSGSTGLPGSADAILNLIADGKRFDGKAVLEYTPRDAESGEMKITFDRSVLVWSKEVDEADWVMGNPFTHWIVDNAPDRNKEGVFVSYREIFRGCFDVDDPDRAGKDVPDALRKLQKDLWEQHRIGLQIGVKSHGVRGVRMYKS